MSDIKDDIISFYDTKINHKIIGYPNTYIRDVLYTHINIYMFIRGMGLVPMNNALFCVK